MAAARDDVVITSVLWILPKLVLLVLVQIALNFDLKGAMAQYTAYCSAYCDVYDNLIPGSYCESNVQVYCCGTTSNKTCCTNKSHEINVDDETVCGHSWMYYQWSLIYGLVAVLMVILMIIICCICCRGYQLISRRPNSSSSSSANRADTRENEADPRTLGFDPSSVYAFEPPRYETLPKDPPKYSEVFHMTEQDNAAFTPDSTYPEPPPLETTTLPQVETSSTTTSTTTTTNEETDSSSHTAEVEQVLVVGREADSQFEEIVIRVVEESSRNETDDSISTSSL